jgi:hypothetical protein
MMDVHAGGKGPLCQTGRITGLPLAECKLSANCSSRLVHLLAPYLH